MAVKKAAPVKRAAKRTTRTSTPTGHDLAVANHSEAVEEAVRAPQLEEPATGKAKGSHRPARNGTEGMEAHSILSLAEAASAFVVPDMSGLHDIGEASFGPSPVLAETVHGPDNRVQITNTAVYPWRAHASLLITARDGSQWIGTGWFIGPHTLMTAGHVVFINAPDNPARHGWVRSITVMPGRNGSSLPYGSVTSSNLRSVVGWTQHGDELYDYGAIILSSDLGLTTGWFGFGVYDDATLTSSTGNISGYPGDKPDGTQWYDARKIASVGARKVFYDIDTFGGQSGSAVYRIVQGHRYGVAVHAYGGATTNSGTRIVLPVFQNMVAWKA